jgi:hypothetical protein
MAINKIPGRRVGNNIVGNSRDSIQEIVQIELCSIYFFSSSILYNILIVLIIPTYNWCVVQHTVCVYAKWLEVMRSGQLQIYGRVECAYDQGRVRCVRSSYTQRLKWACRVRIYAL